MHIRKNTNDITKLTILTYLKKQKDMLYKKYGVTKIGLFGSFARGEEKEDSDIDIAVEIEPSKKIFIIFLV